MMQILPKTNIDFLKYRKFFFAITAVIFIAGFACLFTKGLNFGIQFTGGTMLQVSFEEDVEISAVRSALEKAGLNAELQSFTDKHAFSIKIKGLQENVNETKEQVESALNTIGKPYSVDRTEFVGPAVGKDMSKRAIMALVLALAFMIIYIAFRFQNIVWGAGGIFGILHDVLVMVFAFSLMQREMDLVIVAALLTVAGYSINDTIVIFDRMRENIAAHPKMKMYDIINLSLNETLSRTVITSGLTLIAVAILFFMGGEALQNFSLSMLIGLTCGVYSTIAIATPLVYQWAHSNDDVAGGTATATAQAHAGGAAQHQESAYKKKKKKKYN
ncbi:preprotein translocase subunit SecF [Parelusimicrobium proximum]|uniref:protein translocase subunit SecF n=1 Tax=Parelusimicrobium proximum TaxID=3228953 RepID=UPI003D174CFA